MSRTFAYLRVSTADQDTANQAREIEASGFAVEAHRMVSETISGSTPAMSRPAFAKLLERMEHGDVLVVTKIDRLGRDALDIRATVDRLAEGGIRVHCLALGGADLTSAAGKMVMTVIGAMAEFERDLIIERTNAGLAKAKAAGVRLGRKPSEVHSDAEEIRAEIAEGKSVAQIAKERGVSRMTIMRIRDAQTA
ncbi:recombinase family protein [Burkholderia multivorans]|uniref:recombinase family protein n=1 Tax=Burkholderia multivorans TaxID=87883 RepID=UPI001C21D5A3|nr:recombinase family protein [Burkholderia multivorans]MBU9468153.1 recombinase family protein [Burkholderia multivorans]MCA8129230.1 recombinase family protein [Burkholderia multivorans]HEJ2441816.1 recombinase family protein [Burkholderia multivorans]